MTKTFERYHPDMKALHNQFQTGPCFICKIVEGHPKFLAHIVYEDDRWIAFLDKYPRQYGYTVVAPKNHVEQVTGDLDLDEYLSLQRIVCHVSEAIHEEVDAERMYILTLGSNQGNSHVYWHVVSLPKGTPYEKQQGGAVGWSAGVLKIPADEMTSLASRLRQRIEGWIGD